MSAVRDRLGDTADFNEAQQLIQRHPAGAAPILTRNYVSPAEFARKSEQLAGETRAWDLLGMEFKRDAAKHNAHAEKINAATAQSRVVESGMKLLKTQQKAVRSYVEWQDERLKTEKARTDLATTRLDLKGAIAAFPLRHAQIRSKLESMVLDIATLQQQNEVKREPLTVSGFMRDASVPRLAFPERVTTPEGVDVNL